MNTSVLIHIGHHRHPLLERRPTGGRLSRRLPDPLRF